MRGETSCLNRDTGSYVDMSIFTVPCTCDGEREHFGGTEEFDSSGHDWPTIGMDDGGEEWRVLDLTWRLWRFDVGVCL